MRRARRAGTLTSSPVLGFLVVLAGLVAVENARKPLIFTSLPSQREFVTVSSRALRTLFMVALDSFVASAMLEMISGLLSVFVINHSIQTKNTGNF